MDPDQNAPTFLDPDQILGLFDLSQQNYLYFQVAKSVSYNTVSSVSRKSGSGSSVLMTKNLKLRHYLGTNFDTFLGVNY